MQAIPEGAGPAPAPPRHIVVAVDGSDVAATAVFWAARLLATRREDTLHLARVLAVPVQPHAIPVAPGGAVAALAASLQHSREEERAQAHANLRTLEKDLLEDPQRVGWAGERGPDCRAVQQRIQHALQSERPTCIPLPDTARPTPDPMPSRGPAPSLLPAFLLPPFY